MYKGDLAAMLLLATSGGPDISVLRPGSGSSSVCGASVRLGLLSSAEGGGAITGRSIVVKGLPVVMAIVNLLKGVQANRDSPNPV